MLIGDRKVQVGDRVRWRSDGAIGTVVFVGESADWDVAITRMDGGEQASIGSEENNDAKEGGNGEHRAESR
jgi:plastocyanin